MFQIKPAALLPLLLLPAACSHRGSVVIIDTTEPPTYMESEPNDDAWNANDFGALLSGDLFRIEGTITECCPDPYDGFAFYAPEPVEVFLTLSGHSYSSDLDFCIYDPVADQFIACYESDGDPEFGIFAIAGPGEFHVVVDSYFGDTSYTLEVEVLPLHGHRLAAGQVSAGEGAAAADERWDAYREAKVQALPAELILLDSEGQKLMQESVSLSVGTKGISSSSPQKLR